MNTINKIWVLVLTVGLFAGCSKKEVTLQEHTGQIAETAENETLEVSANQTELLSLNLPMYKAQLSGSGRQALNDAYLPLASILFRPNSIIDHPLDSHSIAASDALRTLNRALLKVLNSTDVTVEEKRKLAGDYSTQVFADCAKQYDNCPRVWFFRNDSNSAEVLMFKAEETGEKLDLKLAEFSSLKRDQKGAACANDAECTELIRSYYRQFLMAFSLRNTVLNSRLGAGYVKYAALYGDFFIAQPAKVQAEWEFQQHRLIFQTAFDTLNLDSEDATMKAMLKQPASFLFSRTRGSAFDDRFFWKASGLYLYECSIPGFKGSINSCPKDKRVLSQEFRDALTILADQENLAPVIAEPAPGELPVAPGEEQSYKIKSISQMSLSAVVRILEKDQKTVLANLGLTTDIERDEYFFLINGVFNGDLSTKDADRFWKSTKQDFPKLQAALEKFIKLYSVFMIGETNAFMNTLYSERAKYTTEKLVRRVITQSDEISEQWVALRDQVEIIRDFTNSSLLSYDGAKALDTKLREFKRSIKFTSVYPSMMMMMYYLSDINYEFKIQTLFWGEITINAAKMIGALFSGSLSPWLYFGVDGTSLDKFEIMYAFYYVLKTETFAAFGNIPSLDSDAGDNRPANIDEYQYFNLILPSIYDAEFQNLVRVVKDARAVTRDHNFPRLQSMCNKLRDPAFTEPSFAYPTSEAHRAKIGTFPEYYDQKLFNELTDTPFLDPNDPLMQLAQKIFDDVLYEKYLVEVNTVMTPLLMRAKDMVSIMKLHYGAKIERETDAVKRAAMIADFQEKTRKVESIIARADNNITAVLSYWTNTNDQLQNCMDMMNYVTRNRGVALYNQEKAYLKKIHNWMTAIQETDPSGAVLASKTVAEAEQILRAAGKTELADSLKGLEVNTTAADLLTAMNAELAKIASHPKVPAINHTADRKYSGFDKISWGDQNQPPHFTYSKTDLQFRFLDYYKNGIAPYVYANVVMPADLTTDRNFTLRNELVYEPSFTAFLRSTGDTLGGTKEATAYLKFWNKMVQFDSTRSRREIVRQIYARGDFPVYSNACADQMVSYIAKFDTHSNDAPPTAEEQAKIDEQRKVCEASKTMRRVTPDELVELQLDAVYSMNLTTDEQTVLKDMNRAGFYPPEALRGMALDFTDINKPQAFFENEMAKQVDVTARYLNLAQSYFISQRNVGTLLFDVDFDVQKAIKCQSLEMVEKQIDNMTAYRDAVLKREKADQALFKQDRRPFTLTYAFDGTDFRTVTSNPNGQFLYITTPKAQDIGVKVGDFHDLTLNFFNRAKAGESEESEKFPIYAYFPTKAECAQLNRADWK